MSGPNDVGEPERKTIQIYACSGAANVAEIADRVARGLSAEGVGTMCCITCLGANQPEDIEAARGADMNIIIDGCEKDCAHNIFNRHGIENIRCLRITDMGIVKLKGVKPTNTQVFMAYSEAKATFD